MNKVFILILLSSIFMIGMESLANTTPGPFGLGNDTDEGNNTNITNLGEVELNQTLTYGSPCSRLSNRKGEICH